MLVRLPTQVLKIGEHLEHLEHLGANCPERRGFLQGIGSTQGAPLRIGSRQLLQMLRFSIYGVVERVAVVTRVVGASVNPNTAVTPAVRT